MQLDTRNAKQTTYTNVMIDVQSLPDGNLALIVLHPAPSPPHVMPTEVLTFPMSVEYAKSLGEKLLAPRVTTARAMPVDGLRKGVG